MKAVLIVNDVNNHKECVMKEMVAGERRKGTSKTKERILEMKN